MAFQCDNFYWHLKSMQRFLCCLRVSFNCFLRHLLFFPHSSELLFLRVQDILHTPFFNFNHSGIVQFLRNQNFLTFKDNQILLTYLLTRGKSCHLRKPRVQKKSLHATKVRRTLVAGRNLFRIQFNFSFQLSFPDESFRRKKSTDYGRGIIIYAARKLFLLPYWK